VRVDVVTMSESDSLDSDSSSVLLRLFVSLGSVVGVSGDALSSGSKSELSCSSNAERFSCGVGSGVGRVGVVSLW
jgi:hypothetical protein